MQQENPFIAVFAHSHVRYTARQKKRAGRPCLPARVISAINAGLLDRPGVGGEKPKFGAMRRDLLRVAVAGCNFVRSEYALASRECSYCAELAGNADAHVLRRG